MGTDDRSNKRSKRSGKRKGTAGKVLNARTVNRPGNAIPRLDSPARGGGGVDKMPSNAPTMAIAPSDYEHIFHEGPAVRANAPVDRSPPAASPSPSPSPNQNKPTANLPPAYTVTEYTPTRSPDAQRAQQKQQNADAPPGAKATPADTELLVSPDGYTYLGQEPDPQRRVALPPHVVRASNQFSRVALARIARYLASRAEPPAQ